MDWKHFVLEDYDRWLFPSHTDEHELLQKYPANLKDHASPFSSLQGRDARRPDFLIINIGLHTCSHHFDNPHFNKYYGHDHGHNANYTNANNSSSRSREELDRVVDAFVVSQEKDLHAFLKAVQFATHRFSAKSSTTTKVIVVTSGRAAYVVR